MGMQNWSDDIVLVDLHREPQMGDELKTVTDIKRLRTSSMTEAIVM